MNMGCKTPKWCISAICLLLASSTFLAYSPVRLNDFVYYDDQQYITENPHVQTGLTRESVLWAFRSSHASNWHPVTWLSHMLDCELFGLNPAGHHLTSVAIHAVNAAILFLLLNYLTGRRWRSALVAAFFALHPVRVESVAWAAERKDVLSGFFGLLCVWCYAVYAQRLAERSSRPRSETASTMNIWIWYSMSVVLLALGLMSKPMLVTIPFLLLLLDYWPLGRLRFAIAPDKSRPLPNLRSLILEKLPFFIITAVSIWVTLTAQRNATRHFADLPFLAKAANALVSYARYLGKAIWPDNLAVLYPHPGYWPATYWAAAAGLLLVLSLAVAVYRQTRPYLAVGWLWFLGTLVPVIGLVQVGVQSMADRYLYFPLIGFFIGTVWLVADVAQTRGIPVRLSATLGALLLACLAILTFQQTRVWRDTSTLFTHAVSVTRSNWVAHSNLASWALRQYQAARAEEAASPGGPGGASDPSASRTYLPKIIYHSQQALLYNPGFQDSRVSLAKALIESGGLDEARQQLEIVLHSDSDHAEANASLAEVFHRLGRPSEAARYYRAALEQRPEWESLLNNFAWLLATHPDAQVRNGAQSVVLAERACHLSGHTNLDFLHTLAAAYAEVCDFPKAVATAERAQDLAKASGKDDLAEKAAARAKLYRSGASLRD